MTSTHPYPWLKQISSEIGKKDSIPLIGSPPPFPWEDFSSQLASHLNLSGLTIKPEPAFEWRTAKDLPSGLGNPYTALQLEVAPTGGNLYWLIAEADLDFLMATLLQHSDTTSQIPEDIREAFKHFLAVEVNDVLQHIPFDHEIAGHVVQTCEMPLDVAVCLDLSISIAQKTIWSRLIISDELQRAWKERYAKRTTEPPLAKNIDLTVHLEAGRTSISRAEWSQVALGDLLLLDACNVQPNGEGHVLLTVYDTPVFRGKVKSGTIKILESPLYREVDIGMSTDDPTLNNPQNDENEEFDIQDDEDFDLDDDDDATHEETETNGEALEDSETEEADEAEEEEGEFEEEDEEEDEFTDDNTFLDENAPTQEAWPPLPERTTRRESRENGEEHHEGEEQHAEEQPKATTAPKEEKLFSPEEIPLSIIVEIGRLQMSVQQLMELQPGNMLDIGTRPENGVDLVVNGRRIAKGELLLIGEALGIRILEIG
ncbi:MAG: type III secretion system cytoplasmic ring protein SctQ [Parachlamydiaceae bacterium]|nr:type III secretion system cytoplasmic ring protein SctQ [Parachlamydiaceae bacterium]